MARIHLEYSRPASITPAAPYGEMLILGAMETDLSIRLGSSLRF